MICWRSLLLLDNQRCNGVTRRILVTNDDGIRAPGIHALADSMEKFGEVHVFAPDRNRSGTSNALSLDNPIRIQSVKDRYTAVQGTPTDCVHLAITGLVEPDPDIVVSGINRGANLGDDVLYSGTVAAAMEGRFLGLSAIAISLVGDQNYSTAALVSEIVMQRVLDANFSSCRLLNVNVPDLPLQHIKGIKITRLGNRHRAEPVIRGEDPRGQPIYWVGKAGAEQDAGEGTDFHAVQNGYVSITPLHSDLTHYQALDEIQSWQDELAL